MKEFYKIALTITKGPNESTSYLDRVTSQFVFDAESEDTKFYDKIEALDKYDVCYELANSKNVGNVQLEIWETVDGDDVYICNQE